MNDKCDLYFTKQALCADADFPASNFARSRIVVDPDRDYTRSDGRAPRNGAYLPIHVVGIFTDTGEPTGDVSECWNGWQAWNALLSAQVDGGWGRRPQDALVHVHG